MAEALKIKLNDLENWLEPEASSIVEPLRAEAKKLLEDTQGKLGDLLESSEKLLDDAEKEIAKGSRKTYRRAKILQKITNNFANLIDELNIPDEISGESLNKVSEDIEKTLRTITQERQKWFRVIAPYFIISRRRFDVTLKRANDSYQKFRTFLSEEYTRAESAESVPPKIENLRQSLIDLGKVKKVKETRMRRKENLEKKIAENQQKVQAIQDKDEVVELSQLNERINELEETVKRELRHLQKPFLKFQTLASNPGYNLSPETTEKLNEYLTDPFTALATEKEGYPQLRKILQKIEDTMNKGKLKLKKSRLRKAEDQINNILNKTALLSLHQNCREAYSKKHQLATSGVISESRNERANLQNKLKDLQRKKRLLETRGVALEKKILEIRRRVGKQKEDLEEIVSEISNKNVQILLD